MGTSIGRERMTEEDVSADPKIQEEIEEEAKVQKIFKSRNIHDLIRVEKEISKKGTLHVLRKGIKDRGAKFRLAFFKPSSGMNPEHQKLYAQNRFSVVRQLKYSKKNRDTFASLF